MEKMIAPPGYYRFISAFTKLNPKSNIPPVEEWFDLFEYPTYSNNHNHPTPSELLEIFPNAPSAIKLVLRKKHEKLETLPERYRDRIAHVHKKYSGLKKELFLELLKYEWEHEKRSIQKDIKRANHLLHINEWKHKPPSKDQITDREVALAKAIPIKDISGIQFNRSGFAPCPFHNERTPSFKVYPDNRFHCFGCQLNGDVIDYVMRSHGIDFLSAVKILINK